MQGPEPYPLPRNFVARYVVGKVALFAPTLWAPAVVFAFVKWQVFLSLFGTFTLVLLLQVPLEVRRAHRQRRFLEMLGRDGIDELDLYRGVRSMLGPMALASIVMGGLFALTRQDWRVMGTVLCLGALIAAMMAVGEFFRWRIYGAWIREHLITLPSRPYDVIEVMSWIDPSWPWRAPRSPSSSPSRSS